MLDPQHLMWMQISAGIAVLLFGLTLVGLIRMRGRIEAARSWDKVEGVITVSRVDQPATHASDDLNDATPVIRYRYRVGGQEFEGDKVAIGGIALTTRVLAAKFVARYPVGARVDVHVDPKQPTEALLEPAGAQNLATVAVLTIAFAAIAGVLTAQALTGRVLYVAHGVPLFVFGLPIVVLLCGGLCAVGYVGQRRLASASLRWPTVAGRITQCEVIEELVEEKDDDDKSNLRRLRPRYQVDLRYAYRVGDRDFVGTDANWGGTVMTGLRDMAEKTAARYRPGQTVQVYYDPDRPRQAVLEPASGEGAMVLLIGAALCAVVGGGFLVFLLKVGFA